MHSTVVKVTGVCRGSLEWWFENYPLVQFVLQALLTLD